MEVAKDYPDIALDHMLVDTCTMRMIQNPTYFDVIVTENTFGDILTDEASTLTGSMGMMPFASIAGIPGRVRALTVSMSRFTAAPPSGQTKANPIATILSVAMMFRYSLGR